MAHGQPSDPGPAEAEVADLAARVERRIPGWRVRGVTLAMRGALETALSETSAPPVVYPLFMSDGWFTATELPRRLAGRALRVAQPLGLDPALADLAAGAIAGQAAECGWSIDSVVLVIAAHGSGRSDNAARATRRFAARIGRRLPFSALRIGYVEQEPSIGSAAAASGTRAICLPFFAARGGHILKDIPDELDRARFAGVRTEPIGTHPRIADLISWRLAERGKTDIPAPPRSVVEAARANA